MRILGMFVVLAVLCACTSEADNADPSVEPSSTSPSAASANAPALPTRAEKLWSVPLRALGQPITAGDSLVAVVQARGDELDIVSLDRDTGDVRWRAPFQATPNTVGVWLGDLVHTSRGGGTFVVYQRAGTGAALADRAAPYLAVEPDTGHVVARTRPLRTAFGAVTCDDGRDVCLRVGKETFDETRWDLDRWRLRPERELPPGANVLGSEGPVHTVHGTVGGYSASVAVGRSGPDGWRRPWTAYVKGKGWRLADNEGWYDAASDVAVVAAAARVPEHLYRRYRAGRPVALDQSRRRTIGIDASSGRKLWQHEGADFRCLELARVGVAVRCAVGGDTVHRDGWGEPRTRDLSVSLEGFHPLTGEATWSHPLPSRFASRAVLDEGKLDASFDRIIDSDTAMVLPDDQGWSVVSLTDGSSRPVRAREAVLCLKKVPFRYALDVPGGRSVFGEERARWVSETCRTDGKASRRPLGAAGLLAGGVDAGDGIRVAALEASVVGYRLS